VQNKDKLNDIRVEKARSILGSNSNLNKKSKSLLIARGGNAAVEIYYTCDDFLVISLPYAEIVEIFQNVWAS
jgi:hypothetical protein